MDLVFDFSKAVFRSVIIVPFTAGSAIHRNNPRVTDGSLASMVTIACLTAVNFVVIGIYGGKRSPDPKPETIIWVLMISLILLALLSVILISILAYRKRSEWFDPSTIQIVGSSKMKIMFLWLFGFGCILQTTLYMAINIECLRDATSKTFWILSILSNIASILYFCLEMGFISYFKHYSFNGCIRINYGILIVLLTNLSLWFHTVVEEMNKSHNSTADFIAVNVTHKCFWESKIFEFLEYLEPFISPVRIEFFLLATGFILGMWPSIKNEKTPTVNTNNVSEITSELTDERSPLLASNMSSSHGTIQYQHTQSRRFPVSSQQHPTSFFVAIVFGVVLNLPLLVTNCVLNFVYGKNSSMFNTWEVMVTIYKMTMLIIILIIFRHLSRNGRQENTPKKLSANEYILIFSTSGTVAICSFGVIAGIQTRSFEGYMVLADNCIDIIGTYLQTILILHSERNYLIRRSSNFCVTEHLFLLLAISNIVFWFLDSFIDVQYQVTMQVEELYFGKRKWEDVKYILFPVLIFYRFHVSMDLYGLFCKYKKTATD